MEKIYDILVKHYDNETVCMKWKMVGESPVEIIGECDIDFFPGTLLMELIDRKILLGKMQPRLEDYYKFTITGADEKFFAINHGVMKCACCLDEAGL